MITREQWLDLIGYRITEGYQYINNHITYNVWSHWDGSHDGCSIELTMNSATHEPVSAEVFDYRNNRAYRRCVDGYAGDTSAWDNVAITELDTDNDFLEKAAAIIAGQDYDTRVVLPLDIPDELANQLMRYAHEQDITFNQLVERIILDAIDDAQHQK